MRGCENFQIIDKASSIKLSRTFLSTFSSLENPRKLFSQWKLKLSIFCKYFSGLCFIQFPCPFPVFHSPNNELGPWIFFSLLNLKIPFLRPRQREFRCQSFHFRFAVKLHVDMRVVFANVFPSALKNFQVNWIYLRITWEMKKNTLEPIHLFFKWSVTNYTSFSFPILKLHLNLI